MWLRNLNHTAFDWGTERQIFCRREDLKRKNIKERLNTNTFGSGRERTTVPGYKERPFQTKIGPWACGAFEACFPDRVSKLSSQATGVTKTFATICDCLWVKSHSHSEVSECKALPKYALKAARYMPQSIWLVTFFPLNCVDGMINMPRVRSRHLQCVSVRGLFISNSRVIQLFWVTCCT